MEEHGVTANCAESRFDSCADGKFFCDLSCVARRAFVRRVFYLKKVEKIFAQNIYTTYLCGTKTEATNIMALIARYSAHIQSDIQRNWSSWNFGLDGFEGTYSELQQYIAACKENDSPVCISMFELYGRDLDTSKFGELKPNYWVVIDTDNAHNGLSCWELRTNDLQEAINLALTDPNKVQSNEGSFDASGAKLLWSECPDGEMGCHIFEIED